MAFTKVLIANRGEIACRIMATAHDLGYRTVAIYSEADSGAPHVQMADQAVCIGPAPVAESYLNVAAILDAAARTGADAVHPGYGFLAENADFAKSCADAGLTFIGPSPQAIELMGNKRLAKLRRIVKRVAKLAPDVLKHHRERLIERLKKANVDVPDMDDDRLLREIVYYTDRTDITEELTRLGSHFVQLEECLSDVVPVGRKLDFLAQEMFREINTIGSKANDANISSEVVNLKTELEKIREQVQNVE